MKTSIKAIYKNGAFQPVSPVHLKDQDVVSMTIESADNSSHEHLKGIEGHAFMDLIGMISTDDLNLMEEAVNDCRKVDVSEW